jgi:L-threonylcarbamoyladenylate synthase
MDRPSQYLHTERILRPEEIEVAVAWLRSGEVVGMPTETVYGLAASAFNEEAVAKVFALKKRPADNPLIVHLSTPEEIEAVAIISSPLVARLTEAFWPGPLTLVVPRSNAVSDAVTGGGDRVAVRVPAHPIARALIREVGTPLVAPSANISGRPSPTEARHVLADFSGLIPGVIDGGACELGVESTVVGLAGERPTLLRPGAINRKEIEEVLGCPLETPSEGDLRASPGTRYRHYAPKASLRFVDSSRGEEVGSLADLGVPFLLSRTPHRSYPFRPLSRQTLYRQLREADALGVSVITVVLDRETLADETLINRLFRAAGMA